MTHESPSEQVPQSFEDIRKTHPGEWILAEITKFDRGTPIEGVVFAHNEFDGNVTKELGRAREEKPDAKFSFFKSAPIEYTA